ncbi:MAG TPA: hypothetical protein VF894_03335 [Anaeromyxobacter sp.]
MRRVGRLVRCAALAATLAGRAGASAQAPPQEAAPTAGAAPAAATQPGAAVIAQCPPGTEPVQRGATQPSADAAATTPVIVCVPVRSPPRVAQAPAPSAAVAAPPAAPPPAPSGSFPPAQPSSADAETRRAAAERALERALVQKGGLVVPPGGVEITPELSYAYADGTPPPAATAQAGSPRREIFTGTMTLRLGLPLGFQAEGKAPFVFARLTPTGDDASGPAEGRGIGDVRLGLTWHALRARTRLPDVLVGGFWKSRSGKTAFDDASVRVPLGSGVEQFGGTLALVKAVDPVVLVATGTYAVSAPRWIPQGWLEAGDQFGGSAVAVLAVSPETSLSFGLEASHARPLSLDHVPVYRSDRTAAVFRVGVATAASRRTFLQVNLGMGLTSDVPRFEISIATPVQF